MSTRDVREDEKAQDLDLTRNPFSFYSRTGMNFLARLAALPWPFALLAAWLAYGLLGTVERIAAYYVPLPVGDYWRVVQNIQSYQSGHFGVLWQQHNEHRIIFPELIFAADVLLDHGRMILTTILSLFCYALAWCGLSATVISDADIPQPYRWTAVLVSGIIVFWKGAAIVLGQPFQLQWTLMQAAVVLALYCLCKGQLVPAIVAAIVATYSSANALVTLPLLFCLGFAMRLKRSSMVWLGICAVVFPALYFAGYKFSGQTNFKAPVSHPGYFAGFAGMYLSMPFGALTSSPPFGIAIGLAAIGVLVSLFMVVLRRGLLSNAPAFLLFGYAAFTLLTVAMTASGRMDPADPNFTAARVSRYLTVPLMNWSALLLISFWISARLQWRVVTVPRLAIAVSMLLLISMYKLQTWQKDGEDYFQVRQLGALSMEAGLLDSQLMERVFPSPEFVAVYLPLLKKEKLAVFHGNRSEWLGEMASAKFGATQAGTVPGEITYTFPVENGVQVVGWADLSGARGPFNSVVLTNESGRIAGFGEWLPAGFPAILRTSLTPTREAWVGFANSIISSRSLSASVVARRGLIRLHGEVEMPPVQAVPEAEIGAPIKNVNWTSDEPVLPGGVPERPKYGWLPSEPIYRSRRVQQHGSGRINSTVFATPANGCVVLPILHGKMTGGLWVRLINAENRAVLAELPFRDGDELWSAWQVALPAEVKQLKISAFDDGRDWFQWLAVSAPLECLSAKRR